jgi:hypothetical protein
LDLIGIGTIAVVLILSGFALGYWSPFQINLAGYATVGWFDWLLIGMVMNGVPLLVVAKNLGHTDTRMVEHHYGHLAPSYITDAIHAGAPRFGISTPSTVVPISRGKSKRTAK